MKVKLSINRYPIKSKEQTKGATGIWWMTNSKRKCRNVDGYYPGFRPQRMSLYYLMKALTSGCTFCPAIFKDNIKNNDNVEQLQVYCVDVDGSKLTPQDFYEKLPDWCKPVFAYYTLSHGIKPYNRFRLVFAFDYPLIIDEIGEVATKRTVNVPRLLCAEIDPSLCVEYDKYRSVKKKLPVIDRNASSLSQAFYGGKGEHNWFGIQNVVKLENLLQNAASLALKEEPSVPIRLDNLNDDDIIYRLVRLRVIGQCSSILERCGKVERGAGEAISTVARKLRCFNRDEIIEDSLRNIIEHYDHTYQYEDVGQFNRIFSGGSTESWEIGRQYWLQRESLFRLLNGIITYETLTNELLKDITSILNQKDIDLPMRNALSNKLILTAKQQNANA